jgi:hypothetical protein
MHNPKAETSRSITRGSRCATLALVSVIAVSSLTWLVARAGNKHHKDKHHGNKHHREEHQASLYRWDLIHLSTNSVLDAGGVDWAKAADGSQITLTGSGTFLADHGEVRGVTGGGTWETLDTNGVSTAKGTYHVTSLVSFDVIPGVLPAGGTTDNIGSTNDSRAGLLVLRILYSDGEGGVLTVSCHGGGPVPAPDSVFEGITTTKGFVAYADRGKPAPGVDANRTTFHVVPRHHDGDCDDDDDDDDDD